MMNIETLLQAAQILESQQSIPPKKRLARGERPTPSNPPISTNILSSTTINTNPITLPLPTSLIKNEQFEQYPQHDLNLNVHHLNHLVQQQQQQHLSRSSQQHLAIDQNNNNHDDDDDDDDMDQNTERNSEMANRMQTTGFRDREIHNRLEKHRRAHLKDCFDNLKGEVPCQRDRKITNLQVLNLAIKYIQSLTRKEREYENEVNQLTSRNVELQRHLSTLKSELNAEGHDVDTWLDTCSDIDRSVSTRTASEAEMYRTFDDDNDDDLNNNSRNETKLFNGHEHIDRNNNHSHHQIKPNLTNSHTIDSKLLTNNNRKISTRQRKRKLLSIPTTNLLESLSTSIPIRSENLLDYNIAKHLRLDQPCNLLTSIKDASSSSTTLTPITDIRYEIVDMFTKGTNSHYHHHHQQQQQQLISPLPSIASLMNRHSSPVVSPTKQTIGINTDSLTTSTTNILHQAVTTS